MGNHVRWLMNVAGVFCVLMYLSGCAHEQVDTKSSLKLSRADMQYKNVYVADFIVSKNGVEEDTPAGFLAESQKSCVNELIKSDLFENVRSGSETEAADSDLIVQGELTRMRIIGGAARFWIGGMAGKSNMTVRVKLVDAGTGLVVAEKDISEDTNPTVGAWSMGGTDRALPTIIGGLIADYVVGSAKK